MTKNRTSRPKTSQGSFRLAALTVALATVLLLVHFPPCGPNGEACAAMLGLNGEPTTSAPSAASAHAATGTSCPLAGRGEVGMECCESGEHEAPSPLAPDSTDKQVRNPLQAPAPTAQCGDCVPCNEDGTPKIEESPDGAFPEVPLYTLLSSYLS